MSYENASVTLIRIPTWAYTPQTTNWSRPLARIRDSRAVRWNALYRHFGSSQSVGRGRSGSTTSRSAGSTVMPGPQKSLSSPRSWTVIEPGCMV